MNLSQAITGATKLAIKYKLTTIVFWKGPGAGAYGYATEHRLLAGAQRLARWRYRVHPDGSTEKL